MNVTIRPMTVADAATVGELHVRAWQVAYRGAVPDQYLDGLRPQDWAERWRRGIEEGSPGRRDVITVEGDVAGFSFYGAELDGDDPARGQLYAIYLHPDHWRRGLGRRLLRHTTAELANLGFTRAVLWVETTNDRARRFYEVEGWQFDGGERAETVRGVTVDVVRYARLLAE